MSTKTKIPLWEPKARLAPVVPKVHRLQADPELTPPPGWREDGKPTCDHPAVCGRFKGHRGQHGGWRLAESPVFKGWIGNVHVECGTHHSPVLPCPLDP